MFAPELTNILKQAMIAAVQRGGGDYSGGCYFADADVQNIKRAAAIQNVDVEHDDILKWANNLRERHADPEHRQLYLKMDHIDDKKQVVGYCLVVCFCEADLPPAGLVIRKARSGGLYKIAAQLVVRDSTSHETRIFLEKPQMRNSLLYKSLVQSFGATQIQVFAFEHNDPKSPAFARKSAEDFALKPGAQVVRLGTFKTPCPPAPPPPVPDKPLVEPLGTATLAELSNAVASHVSVDKAHAGAAEENAGTIAKLQAELAHMRHVTHQLRGQMGAAVRTENTEARRDNKRLKVDVEERVRREQQAYQREQQLMGMIASLHARIGACSQ